MEFLPYPLPSRIRLLLNKIAKQNGKNIIFNNSILKKQTSNILMIEKLLLGIRVYPPKKTATYFVKFTTQKQKTIEI